MPTDDEFTSMSLKHRPSGLAMARKYRRVKLPRVKGLKAGDPAPSRAGKLNAVQKATKAKIICVHCKKNVINRPRGLCWHCYYTPGVKDLYPSTSKYARRGIGNFSGAAELPQFPTRAAPGTPEKVAVLEQRAECKRQVFHPADARYEGDQRTEDWFREWQARLDLWAEAPKAA